MKHLFLCLGIALFFASCGSGGGTADVAFYKHQADSFKTEFEKHFGAIPGTLKSRNNWPIDSFYIFRTTANGFIEAWQNFVQTSQNLQPQIGRSSFVIPASNLRAIDTFDAAVFYLALNQSNQLTLIYVGANFNGNDSLVEMPFHPHDKYYGSNTYFALDQAWPCPTCETIGLQTFKMPHVPTYTLTPTANTGGTVSPSDPLIVPYAGQALFTFNPNRGNYVKDVQVDGISKGMILSLNMVDVCISSTVTVTFAPDTTK